MSVSLSAEGRRMIEASRLFVVVYSPQWARDDAAQAHFAYARALAKPMRVLVMPGVRLPEDAFLGIADLDIYHGASVAESAEQVERWLREDKEKSLQ